MTTPMMTPDTPLTPPQKKRLSFYALRLFVAFLVLFVLLFMCLYLAMGTQGGSKFLLEKIASEANVRLSYGKGNLRDGIWVHDVQIAEDADVSVHINEAYIKMGWRAILAKEVHIRAGQIDTLTIKNKKPPTGEPFDYATVSLPVNLVLEETAVKRISYEQVTREPVLLENIALKKGKWQGSKIELKSGTLDVNDAVSLADISGQVDLSGDYPLNVAAVVTVSGLERHYIDPLTVHATGTLRRTTGTVTGLYHKADVTGQFIAQGLDEGSPFSATLDFKDVTLPYAKSQALHLTDGKLQATGVISNMDLRIQTTLSGKDVPYGRYQGRATLIPSEGMEVHHLSASTEQGELFATGMMDWQEDFYLKSTLQTADFDLAQALADDRKHYADYLPKRLDGSLDFSFWANDDNHSRYAITLNQNDGEYVHADIRTPNEDDNPPWLINANWRNLKRDNVPNVGVLNSPSGEASVRIVDEKTEVKAAANLVKLSVLPVGDYVADVLLDGDTVQVHHATYQGEMGDLTTDGVIYLATDSRPLSYELNGKTAKLVPNAYFDAPNRTPFSYVSGKFILAGRLTKDEEQDLHDVSLKDSDLLVALDDAGKTSVRLVGDTQAKVWLKDSLENFNVSYDGKLITTGINDGLKENEVSLTAAGDLKAVEISRLTLSGQGGYASVAGTVTLTDGVAWEMNLRADKLNTGHFYAQSPMILTGDLASRGRYKDGKLSGVTAGFEGDVLAKDLPSGKLSLDAAGHGNKYTINRLSYQGVDGQLSATGWVDISRGVAADVIAEMTDFNLGVFIKNRPSRLTGNVAAFVDWQDKEQHVDVRHLALSGTMNDVPMTASGVFSATLDIPKDLGAYFNNLKKSSFDLDKILRGREAGIYDGLTELGLQAGQLQGNLAKQDEALRRLVKSLTAKDVRLVLGDNAIGIDGNEQKLAINVTAKDLAQILSGVRGQVTGGLVVVGDENSLPTIYSDLALNNISMPSFAVRNATVLGKVVNLANADSAMVVQGTGVVLGSWNVRQARIDMSGTQQNHNVATFINDGNLQLQSRVQGGFDGRRYTGVLSEGRLQTHYGVLNQLQPAELSYELATGRLALAAHCWQTLSASVGNDGSRGSLCIKDTLRISKDSGHINVALKNLDTAVFTPILPSDLTLRAKLHGEIYTRFGDHNPEIKAVLYSDNGQVGLRNDGLPDTTMQYERISVIAQSVPTGLKLRTDILAGEAGNGYVDVIINPYKAEKPIAGAMVLNSLNLAMLRPFFPAMRVLGGEVNMAGGVGGTLSKPLFYGNASLADGELALVDAPIALTDVELTASIRGTNSVLEGTFKSGAGTGELSGTIDWQRELSARLSLLGENLAISSPPLLNASVSPHLELFVRPRQKYVDLKGVISVPSAIIRPPEATGAVTGESPDVTMIDRRATGNIDALLQVVAPWSINADIGLDLGDEVVFRGFGANLPLAGALHLTQSGQGVMQGRGVIQVSERTTVDAIGQNLELNYAQIRFDGNVQNPRLSIEAVREIDGQTVGVRVTDRLSNPDIRVFNDAGLSEQQAMNALVTGSLSESGNTQISEQGFRSQVTNSLAAAGLSLGLQGTRGVTNEIGRALGLDSLVVDASGNSDDANVNVTGYISPDLYIRYGVGVFNAQSSLSMRYQLTRRVYVEATSATERIVDVVYRWRFK